VNNIQLIIRDILSIGGTNLYLVVLTDVDATRQISVVCDKTAQQLLNLRFPDPKAVTATMLPEVLCNLMPVLKSDLFYLFISDIKDGHYECYLKDNSETVHIKILITDALLLSLVSGMKIFIEPRLLQLQSVKYVPGKHTMQLPVNALSTDMLKKALSDAVSQEDYEQASRIRDEISKREGKTPDKSNG